MIPSYDIKSTASFFKDLFSFSELLCTDQYAVLSKDQMTIHLLNADEDIGEMEFYLEVDNLAELWDSVKSRITGCKVKEPFDRDYGMREFHIEVPHTRTLIFVGQQIKT